MTSTRDLRELFGDENVKKGVPAAVKNECPESVQNVAREKTTYTVGKGYFYRHGNTAEKFQERVLETLAKAGFDARALHCGDHYYHGFEGGATGMSSKSSFFFVVVEVK